MYAAKLFRLEVQVVVANHSRDVVELYEIGITEAHDAHNLLVFIVRQTAEQLVYAEFDVVALHLRCQFIKRPEPCNLIRTFLQLIVSIIALDAIAPCRIAGQLVVNQQKSRVVANKNHRTRVSSMLAIGVDNKALDNTGYYQAYKQAWSVDKHEPEQLPSVVEEPEKHEHRQCLKQGKPEYSGDKLVDVYVAFVNYRRSDV